MRDQDRLGRDSKLAVYGTEAPGALHAAPHRLPRYVSSEYLGQARGRGELVSGVRHEDLQNLTFPDNEFDLVLSREILDHVPDPYCAHKEIRRVLKPGGRHTPTVPFREADAEDQIRAVQEENGEIRTLLEPEYHGDPLQPEGALVFAVFGQEMLWRLSTLGFHVTVHHLYDPRYGIVGGNAIVFEAVKPLSGAIR